MRGLVAGLPWGALALLATVPGAAAELATAGVPVATAESAAAAVPVAAAESPIAAQPAAGAKAPGAALTGASLFMGTLPGVGPLFNAASCNTCHPNGGRGAGPVGDGTAPVAMEVQLESPAAAGTPAASGDPVYGHVLNTVATGNLVPEGVVTIRYSEIYGYYYPDGLRWVMHVPHYEFSHLSHGPLAGTTIVKPRVSPALFGVGLLEAVAAPRHAYFGWQGAAESVRDQTTRALSREMGLTTHDRPADDCTSHEPECAATGVDPAPEVSDEQLEALVAFARGLAPATSPREPTGSQGSDSLGKALFEQIGCTSCHRPELPLAAAGVIRPYTDLLLHDLGSDMADRDVSGARVPTRWRTAPLWGLGYRLKAEAHPTFLHDGRARSPEEAVLWHAGEAAQARRQFMSLGPRSRGAVLQWLTTL